VKKKNKATGRRDAQHKHKTENEIKDNCGEKTVVG
jgi:hypothetical protein